MNFIVNGTVVIFLLINNKALSNGSFVTTGLLVSLPIIEVNEKTTMQ